ncbi:hypothetical protein Godav_019754 [Gossypium davidsonii]|uniref:RNase H type-1 domain-containing protein n=2 Tax=Gossypium davidsonii TaxID=34287 RepID=A0A7J8R0V0_GOSDV|nr:hypothetical protein [Gossypium davidsonii]
MLSSLEGQVTNLEESMDGVKETLEVVKGRINELHTIREQLKDYVIYNPVNPPILAQIGDTKKWERPSKGIFKINFDATVNDNRMGYGVIIRDDDGFVLGGGGDFNEGRFSVLEAECIALEKIIEVADKFWVMWLLKLTMLGW